MDMRSLRLLQRWQPQSTLGPGTQTHLGVSPPSLRQAPETAWRRMLFWLLAPTPADVAPPNSRIPAIRVEFMRAVADIDLDDADSLRNRIALARSLRELWHLRPEVFRIIGVALSQREAESRLSLLNRHFPARAPRSQFGNL